MSEFSAVNRGIKDLFPASTVPISNPSTLSDDVQLVHPAFGPFHDLVGAVWETFTSAGGVNTITTPAVPAARVWYVIRAMVQTDDTTARHMWMDMLRSGIPVTMTDGAPGSVWTSVEQLAAGPFVMPPNSTLRGVAASITAAKKITITLCRIERTLADVGVY